MAFLCQRDSYLREFKTSITASDEAARTISIRDDIFFPEGGGQPGDRGLIISDSTSFTVQDTTRDGCEAILKLAPGTEMIPKVGNNVVAKVDWKLRMDNMIQHSGQHVLSAVFEREFGWETCSWKLTSDGWCYVDVTASSNEVTKDRLIAAQLKVQEIIESRCSLEIIMVDSEEDGKTKGIRGRGLPDSVAFPLRALRIEDLSPESKGPLDVGFCCGTHLRSTSELCCFAIHPDTNKIKKNVQRIRFMFGAARMQKVDTGNRFLLAEVRASLKKNDTEIVNSIEALQISQKASIKNMKDLIVLAAEGWVEVVRARRRAGDCTAVLETGNGALGGELVRRLCMRDPLMILPAIGGAHQLLICVADGSIFATIGDKNEDWCGMIKKICPMITGTTYNGTFYQLRATNFTMKQALELENEFRTLFGRHDYFEIEENRDDTFVDFGAVRDRLLATPGRLLSDLKGDPIVESIMGGSKEAAEYIKGLGMKPSVAKF